MNPFVFFAGWLPIIDMIMSFMALIPGLLTRQSDPKKGTKPVTLKNHRNKKYMHWEKEILKNARDTKRSIRKRQCYSETDRRTMIEVIDEGRDKLLGKILEHAKIEDDNLDMLGKMRNSVRGATVPEPKFWREGLIDLQNDIKEICFLPSNRQQDQLPYGAKQELNVFFEKLLSSANGRLDALLKLYEGNYQGAWLTFKIRIDYGCPRLRAWRKLIYSLDIVGTIGSWGLDKLLSFVRQVSWIDNVLKLCASFLGLDQLLAIFQKYPGLAEMIKAFFGVVFFVLILLSFSTGLTYYRLHSWISGGLRERKCTENMKISNDTKKSWLTQIYDSNTTWCLWWHRKKDPSLQEDDVYDESAGELERDKHKVEDESVTYHYDNGREYLDGRDPKSPLPDGIELDKVRP